MAIRMGLPSGNTILKKSGIDLHRQSELLQKCIRNTGRKECTNQHNIHSTHQKSCTIYASSVLLIWKIPVYMRYVGTSPPLNNMVKICRNSGFFFLKIFQGKRIRQQCRHCHINTGSYYSDQYCNSICPEYICSIIPDKLIGMNTELFWKKEYPSLTRALSEVIDDINNKINGNTIQIVTSIMTVCANRSNLLHFCF